MFALVLIFLVAFILVPLIDLVLNERVRIPVKCVVYAATLIYILFFLVTTKVVP